MDAEPDNGRECEECREPVDECLCVDPEADEAQRVLRGHVPFGSGEYGDPDEEDEDICGETMEHDIQETGPGSWRCRRCDAEITEDVTGRWE